MNYWELGRFNSWFSGALGTSYFSSAHILLSDIIIMMPIRSNVWNVSVETEENIFWVYWYLRDCWIRYIYFHSFKFSILNPSGDFSGCLLTDYLIMKVFVFLLLLNHITSMTQSQSINSVRGKNAFKPVRSYALLPTQFSLASVSRDFD